MEYKPLEDADPSNMLCACKVRLSVIMGPVFQLCIKWIF